MQRAAQRHRGDGVRHSYLLFIIFGALCLGLCMATVAQTSEIEGLEVIIEPVRDSYGREEPIDVVCIFCNGTGRTLTFLQWLTPFEGFYSDMFVFRHEGDLFVPYRGILVKRELPPGPDASREYIVLGPGECREVIVNLAEVYEATDDGSYTLQLQTTIADYGFDVPPEVLLEEEDPPAAHIESNMIAFHLEGGREFESPKISSTSGASAAERDTIQWALWGAQDIVLNALGMLNSTPTADRSSATRYTTWFGGYNTSRYGTVVSHFEDIADALVNEDIAFTCHSSACKPNWYAFVYGGGAVEIFLCDVFWNRPKLGTDSQAGTILHEISHEAVSTKDHVYGQSGCETLASSKPGHAINNADSHEYFAENTPSLAMSPDAGWCDCSWQDVGYNKSHFTNQGSWCPQGTYPTQFDLDNASSYGENNSPIVRSVRCCRPCAAQSTAWGASSWQNVGYNKTHFTNYGTWCSPGFFVRQLDIDGYSAAGGGNGPIVGKADCCRMGDPSLQSWGESYWFTVGGLESHNPLRAWCPAGSFITQLDYDGGAPMEGPYVAACRCTRPD